MENFSYHRPAKAADAVKAMKKAKDGKYMAGGMTLLPTIKQGLASPTDIIDLGGIKNAGVAVPITGIATSPVEGSATLTDAQAADLVAGKYYVNIHTAANPGGEIRGQVMK